MEIKGLDRSNYLKFVYTIKNGDLDGFSSFYDACAPMFYGYIKKSLYKQVASEQTLHQAFCTIWKSRDQFDPLVQGLFVWSFKIVKSEVSKTKVELVLNEIFSCQERPEIQKAIRPLC